MDFSTVDLALSSLARRRPPLSTEVLDLSARLSSLLPSHDDDDDDEAEYVRGALRLVELGSIVDGGGGGTAVRWEPMAVGLRLIVDYLSDRTSELRVPSSSCRPPGGGVYADGPRVPEVVAPGGGEEGDDGTTTSSSSSRRRGRIRSRRNRAKTTTTTTTTKTNYPSPVLGLMLSLPSIVDANVEHPEPRVRSLVASVVGAHALYATSLLLLDDRVDDDDDDDDDGHGGGWLPSSGAISEIQAGRRRIHAAILRSLRLHFRMKAPVVVDDDDDDVGGGADDGTKKKTTTSSSRRTSRASDGALDDTTGWRALETNLVALAGYVDGCVHASYVDEEYGLFVVVDPPPPSPRDDDDDDDDDRSWFLPGLRMCCVSHVNRHVRAAGAALVGAIVGSCARMTSSSSSAAASGRRVVVAHPLLVDVDSGFRKVVGDALGATLADNWSQVRMAGSVLCRGYVTALMGMAGDGGGEKAGKEEEEATAFEEAMGDLVPMLLPRMCLNRFYLAQGVKLYSQETWRLVFGPHPSSSAAHPDEGALHSSEGARGGGGLGAVARNAAPLCRYYSKMCDADNHAVREAACQGVAELAQKVGRHPIYAECLSPYVTMLLQALLMCFHDESWPVRDEACLACGTFCIAYPDECRPELPTLFDRWTEQLTDQIWSVREDAAVALGDAIAAYGPDMLGKVLTVIRASIPAAREQPAMSREEYKKLQNDAGELA
ncbi:hypothetical protein ACHAW5_005278 [Stephanodiscus triporus]|uniref:HEAT repeat-containing protein 1 n=1 Tax=Stephanodiscus triporus TaxID=2934178 RepID=A0ABD3PDR3_9STRA